MKAENDVVEIPESQIRDALLLVHAWRLSQLCQSNDDYLDWTAQKFPGIGQSLLTQMPAAIERAAENRMPLAQFALLLEGIANAHAQCYEIWRQSQAGRPVSEPMIPAGGFLA